MKDINKELLDEIESLIDIQEHLWKNENMDFFLLKEWFEDFFEKEGIQLKRFNFNNESFDLGNLRWEKFYDSDGDEMFGKFRIFLNIDYVNFSLDTNSHILLHEVAHYVCKHYLKTASSLSFELKEVVAETVATCLFINVFGRGKFSDLKLPCGLPYIKGFLSLAHVEGRDVSVVVDEIKYGIDKIRDLLEIE